MVIALVVVLVLVIGGGLTLVLTQRGKAVQVDAQGQPQPQPQGQQQTQGQGEQSSQPQQQPQGQGQSQEQEQSQEQGQQNSGPAPEMPRSFGEFELIDFPKSSTPAAEGDGNFYAPAGATTSEKVVWVAYMPGKTLQDLQNNGQVEFKDLGAWACAEKTDGGQGVRMCGMPAYGGLALLLCDPAQYGAEELTKIGDEFMAAWK
ncbi:MAG: hypothetical protein Q4D96_10760 [Propionibacteriaceae bacterium]|nr:hypothetical protein [Propionibacteriaceae bacterium]